MPQYSFKHCVYDTRTGESIMAFGDQSKNYKDSKKNTGIAGVAGEKKIYVSQWSPLGPGVVIFRPLQLVENGKLVLTQRKSPNGKLLFDGGKKSGKNPDMAPEPAAETVFMAAWWDVNVDGNTVGRRIMLDPNAGGDVNKARFNNPIWKHIQDNEITEPMKRSAVKNLFAFNAIDLTPVMRNAAGQIFYPSEQKTWNKLASGDNGKIIDPKTNANSKYPVELPEHWNADVEEAIENEWATPLNEVRIFMGTYGKPLSEGGKHLFTQFEALINTVEDGNGTMLRLGEFNVRCTTTGLLKDTQRQIRDAGNYKPMPMEFNLMPRYDLESWTRPWPNEAVEELLEGRNYTDVVDEYKLVTFPSLKLESVEAPVAEDEEGLFEE